MCCNKRFVFCSTNLHGSWARKLQGIRTLTMFNICICVPATKHESDKYNFTFFFDQIKKKVTPTSACQLKCSSRYKAATHFCGMCCKDCAYAFLFPFLMPKHVSSLWVLPAYCLKDMVPPPFHSKTSRQ